MGVRSGEDNIGIELGLAVVARSGAWVVNSRGECLYMLQGQWQGCPDSVDAICLGVGMVLCRAVSDPAR